MIRLTLVYMKMMGCRYEKQAALTGKNKEKHTKIFKRFGSPLILTTIEMILFDTLTQNLITFLLLLSSYQRPLENDFETTLLMKKYLKNQQFIMKIH